MRVRLNVSQIEDFYTRDNFKRLQIAIEGEPVLKTDFKFFEIITNASVLKFKYPHNLNFIPKDILFLSATNDADVTFHYDLFDFTNIVFTTTVATTFRCFIGSYREEILR